MIAEDLGANSAAHTAIHSRNSCARTYGMTKLKNFRATGASTAESCYYPIYVCILRLPVFLDAIVEHLSRSECSEAEVVTKLGTLLDSTLYYAV